MRPAIEAGLTRIAEAALAYMRQLLDMLEQGYTQDRHLRLVSCSDWGETGKDKGKNRTDIVAAHPSQRQGRMGHPHPLRMTEGG